MPNVTGAAAKGYWPAFWALGAPFRGNYWNWPGIGELDIMENVQGLNNNWSTMHCGTSPGGPCNETTGIGGQRACDGATCQGGFHTYAVEWDRSGARRTDALLPGRRQLPHRQPEPGRRGDLDQRHQPRLLRHPERRHGRRLPRRVRRRPRRAAPSPATRWSSTTSPCSRQPAPAPPPAHHTARPGSRDAYGTIQAESYDQQSGVVKETTTDSGGGQDIGSARQRRLGALQGRGLRDRQRPGSSPPGWRAARPAGSAAWWRYAWTAGATRPSAASPWPTPAAGRAGAPSRPTSARVTGTHDVYLTFTSGQGADFVNVNWFALRPLMRRRAGMKTVRLLLAAATAGALLFLGAGGGTATAANTPAAAAGFPIVFQNNTHGAYADAQIYVTVLGQITPGQWSYLKPDGSTRPHQPPRRERAGPPLQARRELPEHVVHAGPGGRPGRLPVLDPRRPRLPLARLAALHPGLARRPGLGRPRPEQPVRPQQRRLLRLVRVHLRQRAGGVRREHHPGRPVRLPDDRPAAPDLQRLRHHPRHHQDPRPGHVGVRGERRGGLQAAPVHLPDRGPALGRPASRRTT